MIHVYDSVPVDASGLVRTKDGYLVGNAKISRAGNVQQYMGYELGLTGDDAKNPFGVYRDPDVVFDKASMKSLAGRPVTRNHPSVSVTADNWKDLAKGHVGQSIARDGEHVVASMAIMDASAVEEIESGARSLSAGYSVGIQKEDGVSPDGVPYQYKQVGDLRFNHVAYLPGNNPRAGNTRIGDQRAADVDPPAQKPNHGGHMADNMQVVIVDGLSVTTTDQGAQAIAKLTTQVNDAKSQTAALVDSHKTAIAAKDAEIAKKDAEIDALKGKVLSDAALDARVAARADLIAKAKRIADQDYTGKSDNEIRKAAVVAKLGDAVVAGKSDEYIAARFDIAAEDSADPVRAAVKDSGFVSQTKVHDNGYAASVAALNPKKEA